MTPARPGRDGTDAGTRGRHRRRSSHSRRSSSLPTNPERGLDPHQGAVLLHDGDDRPADRGPQRLADHGDPDRAVSASRRSCSRGPAPAPSRCSAPACRDARTSTRCRRCSTTRSSGSGAATPRTRRRSRSRPTRSSRHSIEEALDGRRRRLHRDRPRASRSSSSAGSHPERTSTPRVRFRTGSRRELSSRDGRGGAVLRRPSRVDAERVGRLPASPPPSAGSAPITSSPSSANCSTATQRAAAPTTS